MVLSNGIRTEVDCIDPLPPYVNAIETDVAGLQSVNESFPIQMFDSWATDFAVSENVDLDSSKLSS